MERKGDKVTRDDLRKLTVLIEKISEGKVEHLSELQEVEKMLDEYNIKGKGSVNTQFQAEVIYDHIIHSQNITYYENEEIEIDIFN